MAWPDVKRIQSGVKMIEIIYIYILLLLDLAWSGPLEVLGCGVLLLGGAGVDVSQGVGVRFSIWYIGL